MLRFTIKSLFGNYKYIVSNMDKKQTDSVKSPNNITGTCQDEYTSLTHELLLSITFYIGIMRLSHNYTYSHRNKQQNRTKTRFEKNSCNLTLIKSQKLRAIYEIRFYYIWLLTSTTFQWKDISNLCHSLWNYISCRSHSFHGEYTHAIQLLQCNLCFCERRF